MSKQWDEEKVKAALKDAITYTLLAWDAMHEAEIALGDEKAVLVSTDVVEAWASSLNTPRDITDDFLDEMIADLLDLDVGDDEEDEVDDAIAAEYEGTLGRTRDEVSE